MKYIGNVSIGLDRYAFTDEYNSREEAATAAFTLNPNAKEVSTGFGYHGGNDIRWHRRNLPGLTNCIFCKVGSPIEMIDGKRTHRLAPEGTFSECTDAAE